MLWVFASLPLFILLLMSWVTSGLVIVRKVLRITNGLEVCALSLPIGMVLHLLIVNGLGYLVFFPVSAWVVTVGALLISLFFLTRPLPPLEWEIPLRTRLILAALLAVVSGVVFYINAREFWGDDPSHATMINLIANGEFPLRFQCNPALRAAYGYGGDLLSAVVQVVGGTTPWDCEDVVRFATVTSVIMLAFLIGWRHKRQVGAGLLSVFLIFTAATMIWLYLPLSTAGGRYLAVQTPDLAPLPPALDGLVKNVWNYSILTPGFITTAYSHSERSISWGLAPFVILLYLAILDTRLARIPKSLTLGVIMGLTGLLHPAVLFIIVPGTLIYTILRFVTNFPFRERHVFPPMDFNPILVFGLAFVLLVTTGGVVTDSILDKRDGITNGTTTFYLWPTTVLPSCRDGAPSLSCVMLSVANMGLAPLLIPMLLWLAWCKYRRSSWLIILIGSLVSILATFVLRYRYDDWNIVRLITFGGWTAAVLLGPVLYDRFMQPGLPWKLIVGAAVLLTSYTGVVEAWTIVDGTQVGDSYTQAFTTNLDPLDLAMMHLGLPLPLDARIFDASGCMAATMSRPGYLFGRYAISTDYRDSYDSADPTFAKIVGTPTPELLYGMGYTHLYLDSHWYFGLAPDYALGVRTAPLQVLGWVGNPSDFRALFRICAPDEVCVPVIPTIMDEEMIPTSLTFGNLIQVTDYRQRVYAVDHTVHVDFAAVGLKPMTDDYHYTLRLTRASDGKIFTVNGALAKSTRDWAVNQPYARYDVTFTNIPPGTYHLSMSWYDADAPDSQDLHSLPVLDAAGKIMAWDAMLDSWLDTPYTQ